MVEKEGGVGDLGVLERIEIFKGYWLFCNVKNLTWFDATLVYRFNECNRRSYNS